MTPEDFPAAFAEGWALDKPGPFLDYFRPLYPRQRYVRSAHVP
jgi:hypothetical protein